MNLPTIEVDRTYAARQLDKYIECLERAHNEEYQRAVAALEQAVQGRALVQLSLAFEQAGLDEDNRPRLAIARADRRQVRFSWTSWGPSGLQFNTRTGNGGGDTLLRTVPWAAGLPAGGYGARKPGWSLVPMIPPDVRIEHPQSYDRKRFILWEVEEWFDRPLIAQPDRDPLLLEHIHDDLYAVLAAWDLTELERMIMLGRRLPA